jgi:phosphonate transport system substrate-binding protein
LQQYLEKALQRPVEFYTAAGFDAYVASLMAGEYDIAIAPPHFAVLAMEKGYTPLFHFHTMLEPVLAVRAGSAIRSLSQLRGKRIAMADKSAFIRIVIVRWLADNGLVAGKDYEIVERPTHAASASAVLVGEADAALTTTTAAAQMAPDLKKQLFLLSPGLRFPHLFTLAQRRLGSEGIEQLREALKRFGSTPEGRQFFASSTFGGYEAVNDDEIRLIKPYAEAYRHLAAERQ